MPAADKPPDLSTLILEYSNLLDLVGQHELSRRNVLAAREAAMARADQSVEQIKLAIRAGHTTGDQALDLTVLMTGTLDYQSLAYKSAEWLISQLKIHAGERIMQARRPGLWVIGRVRAHGQLKLLPSNPNAGIDEIRGGYGYNAVALSSSPTGCVAASSQSLLSSPMTLALTPVFNPACSSLIDPDRPARLYIGDAAVAGLVETFSPEVRFALWVVTRRLGDELGQGDPVVLNQIKWRREAMIPRLIQAQAVVEDYRRQLAIWQQDPAACLSERGKLVKIEATATGVILDFGFAHVMDVARLRLERLVETCQTELEMADNPTFQSALAALEA